jgi:hypothetical protein
MPLNLLYSIRVEPDQPEMAKKTLDVAGTYDRSYFWVDAEHLFRRLGTKTKSHSEVVEYSRHPSLLSCFPQAATCSKHIAAQEAGIIATPRQQEYPNHDNVVYINRIQYRGDAKRIAEEVMMKHGVRSYAARQYLPEDWEAYQEKKERAVKLISSQIVSENELRRMRYGESHSRQVRLKILLYIRRIQSRAFKLASWWQPGRSSSHHLEVLEVMCL